MAVLHYQGRLRGSYWTQPLYGSASCYHSQIRCWASHLCTNPCTILIHIFKLRCCNEHNALRLCPNRKVILQPKWIENFLTHSARISAPNSRRGSKVVPEREFGEDSFTACRKLQICLGADRPCHLRAQVWEIHKLRWDPKQPKFIKNQYHCIKQCCNAYEFGVVCIIGPRKAKFPTVKLTLERIKIPAQHL